MPDTEAQWKMTLRLSAKQVAFLDAIAKAEDCSRTEVIRAAISRYIATQQTDPTLRKRMAAKINENNEALRGLLDG